MYPSYYPMMRNHSHGSHHHPHHHHHSQSGTNVLPFLAGLAGGGLLFSALSGPDQYGQYGPSPYGPSPYGPTPYSPYGPYGPSPYGPGQYGPYDR